VYIAELDVELVLESLGPRATQAIPKFPSVRRDLSLVLERKTRYVDVEQVIRHLTIPELVRIEPFDRLETGAFPESKYALAISLTYQSLDRTLTDDEVDSFTMTALNALTSQLRAELRK